MTAKFQSVTDSGFSDILTQAAQASPIGAACVLTLATAIVATLLSRWLF